MKIPGAAFVFALLTVPSLAADVPAKGLWSSFQRDVSDSFVYSLPRDETGTASSNATPTLAPVPTTYGMTDELPSRFRPLTNREKQDLSASEYRSFFRTEQAPAAPTPTPPSAPSKTKEQIQEKETPKLQARAKKKASTVTVWLDDDRLRREMGRPSGFNSPAQNGPAGQAFVIPPPKPDRIPATPPKASPKEPVFVSELENEVIYAPSGKDLHPEERTIALAGEKRPDASAKKSPFFVASVNGGSVNSLAGVSPYDLEQKKLEEEFNRLEGDGALSKNRPPRETTRASDGSLNWKERQIASAWISSAGKRVEPAPLIRQVQTQAPSLGTQAVQQQTTAAAAPLPAEQENQGKTSVDDFSFTPLEGPKARPSIPSAAYAQPAIPYGGTYPSAAGKDTAVTYQSGDTQEPSFLSALTSILPGKGRDAKDEAKKQETAEKTKDSAPAKPSDIAKKISAFLSSDTAKSVRGTGEKDGAEIIPNEIRLTFKPDSEELSIQTVRWIKSFAQKVKEDPDYILEVRMSESALELQARRFSLIRSVLGGEGVDPSQIYPVVTSRGVNTVVLRTVYSPEESIGKYSSLQNGQESNYYYSQW